MNKRLALFQWMQRFPGDSIERLRQINTSATSARHVLLALAFGLFDKDIRRINRVIVCLLVRRMQARRAGELAIAEQLQNRLDDLHIAIDWATGVYQPMSNEPIEQSVP